jgi:hypothetical protein
VPVVEVFQKKKALQVILLNYQHPTTISPVSAVMFNILPISTPERPFFLTPVKRRLSRRSISPFSQMISDRIVIYLYNVIIEITVVPEPSVSYLIQSHRPGED